MSHNGPQRPEPPARSTQYRNRARERQQGKVDRDFEALDPEVAAAIDVEASKHLGGSERTTHLVKGLDVVLAARVERELAEKEDDDIERKYLESALQPVLGGGSVAPPGANQARPSTSVMGAQVLQRARAWWGERGLPARSSELADRLAATVLMYQPERSRWAPDPLPVLSLQPRAPPDAAQPGTRTHSRAAAQMVPAGVPATVRAGLAAALVRASAPPPAPPSRLEPPPPPSISPAQGAPSGVPPPPPPPPPPASQTDEFDMFGDLGACGMGNLPAAPGLVSVRVLPSRSGGPARPEAVRVVADQGRRGLGAGIRAAGADGRASPSGSAGSRSPPGSPSRGSSLRLERLEPMQALEGADVNFGHAAASDDEDVGDGDEAEGGLARAKRAREALERESRDPKRVRGVEARTERRLDRESKAISRILDKRKEVQQGAGGGASSAAPSKADQILSVGRRA